jgi:hypothetical protein
MLPSKALATCPEINTIVPAGVSTPWVIIPAG